MNVPSQLTLKRFLFAVVQMLLIGAVLASVLVVLGKGPWSRWLPPVVLIAMAWGTVSVLRHSRGGAARHDTNRMH